jgi:sugar (pentulose or hexulose) kinase
VLAALGADVSGPVSLTGGATRNAWWNQLRTDVLGRATVRPRSSEAAIGMAILACAPAGQLTDTAERLVTVGERYAPDARRGAELQDGYRRLVGSLADRGWLARSLADAALADGVLTAEQAAS